MQFAQCEPEGNGLWQLCGLLRGRGGTEIEALAGHEPGAPVTLLDDRLVPLPANPYPALAKLLRKHELEVDQMFGQDDGTGAQQISDAPSSPTKSPAKASKAIAITKIDFFMFFP